MVDSVNVTQAGVISNPTGGIDKTSALAIKDDKNGVKQMPLEDSKKEITEAVPKLERTPSSDTVNFSVNEKMTEKNKNSKKGVSTGKKCVVGVASALIPGLGQVINNQWGKAAGFFSGQIAVGALAKCRAISLPVAVLTAIGDSIWSIVDAVKNTKADE
ncbi:hypothetical protein IJG72_03170 [bacterium]|nr:hypothetical protein [bacterium]